MTHAGILLVIDKKLDEIADRVLELSDQNIRADDHVVTGDLIFSGKIERKFLEKTVLYDAPHAIYVHDGTVPHRPPVEPLIRWAMQKFSMDEKEATRVAWAVAAKIEKYGTEPSFFLLRAVDQVVYGGGL